MNLQDYLPLYLLLENNFPVYGTNPHKEKEFINCLEHDERTADKWSTVIMKDADRLMTDILSVMSNENRQRPSVHTDDIYDMCCSIVDKTIDVIYLRFLCSASSSLSAMGRTPRTNFIISS